MESRAQSAGRVGADSVDIHRRDILYDAANAEYSDKYTDSLRILLEDGVPPEPIDRSSESPFLAVLRNGDLESVQLMIDHGIDLQNYVRQCPLHEAASNPRVEVLKFLVSTEIFDLNATNQEGQIALYDSLLAKNFEAVEFLISLGLDPNSLEDEGSVPLHCIDYDDGTEATTKCIEIMLRHGADPDAEETMGSSSMIYAVVSEHHSEYRKRLRLFIEHGAGTKNEEVMYHILKTLTESGDLESLQLYIKKRSIDLSKSKDKVSLSMAMRNRDPSVLEFLLNTGLFDLNDNNGRDMSLLHSGVEALNPEALGLLLDWGVAVDLESNIGFTPLHFAASYADAERRGRDARNAIAKCIEILFLHGADFNSKHLDGETAFEIAMPKDIGQRAEISKITPRAMSILAQANLLESQGKHLNSKKFYQREVENKLCQAELEALKAEILGDSITLYDILAGGLCRFYSKKSELMRKLRDCEYVRSLEDKFPIYGRRLVKLVDYVKVREIAAERLSRLTGLDRDSFHLIIEKIVGMLCVKDLRAINKM